MRKTQPLFGLGLWVWLFLSCASRPAMHQVQTGAGERAAMLRGVDAVGTLFRERYAPAQFKEETLGWNGTASLARLRHQVETAPVFTVADFQRELRRFFRGHRDLHTSMRVTSPRAVWLGLHLRRVEGRTRVAWIDRAALPVSVFPFSLGDEVVSFDGQSIDTALALSAATTQLASTPAFEQSLAEWLLTFRASDEWPEVPTPGASVVLELRDSSSAVRPASLKWLDVDQHPPSSRCPFWGMTRPGYLPVLGTPVWDAGPDTVYPARIDEVSGKRYGFLRLHTYELTLDRQLRAVKEVREALAWFRQERIAALLIDQTGNGGGNYYFGLALLRDLFVAPVNAPAQRFRMTGEGGVVGWGNRENIEKLVADLGKLGIRHPFFHGKEAFLPPSSQTVQDLEQYFGRFLTQPPGTVLTEPLPSIGMPLSPREVPLYEGPVVMVIDEMNLSAPEFVAAALRDSGRVSLFGTTTSGAGGDQRSWVTAQSCAKGEQDDARPLVNCVAPALAADLKRLGIAALNYTVSMGVRADGRFIENQGVTPDVAYALTAEDLTTGFQPLRQKLLEVLGTGNPAANP